MRTVTITLWAALVPFVTLALAFALVLWLRPEWHNQGVVAPISIVVAIIAGGSALFRMSAALPWRILGFAVYAIALVLPLLYFGAFFVCSLYGCPP